MTFDVVVSNTEDQTDPWGHLVAVRDMLNKAVARNEAVGRRPLVIFPSGCKDYGAMKQKHGDPALEPHTEESSLVPTAFLVPRSTFGSRILDKAETQFDCGRFATNDRLRAFVELIWLAVRPRGAQPQRPDDRR